MKTLVFNANAISGDEPETSEILEWIGVVIYGNLMNASHESLRVTFNTIIPGENQTVQSLLIPRLKNVFDDWCKQQGKTYRVFLETSTESELSYIFYIDDGVQGQEAVEAQQPTFAPTVVDDIFFKDERGQLIPFFATPIEKFETFSRDLLTKMEEHLTHPNGRFFIRCDPCDPNPTYGFVRDINKHFDVTLMTEEEFEKFKDFFPNKVPDHISRIWMRYWVGLNRKVLVCFNNTIYQEGSSTIYTYVYAILESKDDINAVDVLEKLNLLLKLTGEEEMENE